MMSWPQSRHVQSPFLAWVVANKHTIATGAGAAVAAYLAYKAYTSESARKLAKLQNTLANFGEAFGSLSASAALVANDLNTFLNSDAEDLPRSIKQLNKLLQSQDVQDTITTAATSVAKGVSHATASTSGADAGPSMLDKVLEAVLSDRGRSLVGMAVGLATKNITTTFCDYLERRQQQHMGDMDHMEHGAGSGPSPAFSAVISLLASDQGERIMSLLITKSIRTAVSTYVDATMSHNFYEDMMVSISKQEHRDAVTDIMSRVTAAFCREVAMAYKKSQRSPATSLQTSSSSASSISLASLNFAVPANGNGPVPSVLISEGSGNLGARRMSHETVPNSARLSTTPSSPMTSPFAGRGATGALQQALHNQSQVNKANAPRTQGPMWLRQVVDLAKEHELRSLALDVVKSATREATKSTIETLVYGNGNESKGLVSCVRFSSVHMYTLLTVLVAMMMYALTPQTVVL